jgi:alcohol dehydrogenase class IV
MKDFIFRMPGRVEVGYSKSKRMIKIIKEMGIKRLLIVVDYNLIKKGVTDYLFDILDNEKINYKVFDEVKQEPTITEIDQAIKDLKVLLNYDGIIAIGGGSTIDVAKLLAVSGNLKDSVKKYVGTNLIAKQGIPMIIIPTTSGAGAEATPNAIVKDEQEKVKKGIVSPFLIPDVVILDPELTQSLPAKITAETGIDAFTHAIECFIGKKSNPMSDIFCLNSIKLVMENLFLAVKNGQDKKARYNMILASFYGGVAIANSGTGGVHALAYPLGGKYNMSHGLSNALLLVPVMEYNAEAVPEKFIEIARTIGLESNHASKEQIVESTLAKIKELVESIGISKGNFKLSKAEIHNIAKSAMSQQRLLQNNPRPINLDDVKTIYRSVFCNK